MGKGARNRGIHRLAEAATIGKPADVTKSVARKLRNDALNGRRARPKSRMMRYLEHVARTQPPEHRR